MKGYYNPEQSGNEGEVTTGRLSIEVENLPEFRKLVEQAKHEADQLKKTIDQLQRFELNIDFSSKPTADDMMSADEIVLRDKFGNEIT